jgi:branched-chain amino acid transport system substrate-binding protein
VAHLLVDSDFGRYPLQAGRNYAADNNIFWYHEGFLNPNEDQKNIAFEVNRLKAARPDWTLIQADTSLTAKLLKEIKQVGVEGRFAGMPTTGGPALISLAGSAAEGYYAGVTLPYATDESPGMLNLQKWWTANSRAHRLSTDPEIQEQYPNEPYIQGWVTANVLLEGIKRAAIKGSVTTGDEVKNGLETLENFTADGLLPALTYNARNHKGTNMRFYRVTGGRWQLFLSDVSLAELEMQPYQVTPTPPTPTPAPRR